MFKRIMAVLLCVLLLASVLPFSASAETETDNEAEAARIQWEISRMYYRVLYATGRSSLHGFCGLMASYQLWLLGINHYPIVYNGNDQFDAYKNMDVTECGFKVKAYSAREYNLEAALNTISDYGTKNVYNILVGFQWTNTEAGRLYGHALVINAIIDGKVYFSEGYASEFNLNPGMPCVATISEFARSYNAWASYEGLIVFGRKEYTDFCTEYPAHLFITAKAPQETYTIPSTQEGVAIRMVRAGEHLEVTGVFENPDGELFYRIADCGKVCYILGENTEVLQFNQEAVTLTDGNAPQILSLGEEFDLTGRVFSQNLPIDRVRVNVSAVNNKQNLSWEFEKGSKLVILGNREVNDTVNFRELPKGRYEYSVSADVTNHYIEDGTVAEAKTSICLTKTIFAVDTQILNLNNLTSLALNRQVLNGWEYNGGAWYYYTDGVMRTGWFCRDGIDYYMQDDGTAATGWQKINGKDRYFTSTGALWTGWLETEEGTYYMRSNGVAAKGKQTIDGVVYEFDQNGLLITEE